MFSCCLHATGMWNFLHRFSKICALDSPSVPSKIWCLSLGRLCVFICQVRRFQVLFFKFRRIHKTALVSLASMHSSAFAFSGSGIWENFRFSHGRYDSRYRCYMWRLSIWFFSISTLYGSDNSSFVNQRIHYMCLCIFSTSISVLLSLEDMSSNVN